MKKMIMNQMMIEEMIQTIYYKKIKQYKYEKTQ